MNDEIDERIQITCDYLVADTTAFIKCANLQTRAKQVYTVDNVLNEVKNRRQLRRLAVLPYELQVKDVFDESLKFVTDFAKKTGDYPSLSATDLQVIALTYQLEKEINGDEHLKVVPDPKKVVLQSEILDKGEKPFITVPGFDSVESEPSSELGKNDGNEHLEDVNEQNVIPEINADNSTCDEESDDDNGWITKENYPKIAETHRTNRTMFTESKTVAVACMTTDFAMQNVLMHIGLNVIALDGRLIRELRTFILRCVACGNTTSLMTKVFCAKCGHKALKKVGVSTNQNGEQIVHINNKRPLRMRKQTSLPTPKGGKHANNPILFEDQPLPHQKPSRLARGKVNILEADYVTGYSPFAVRDVTSRALVLGYNNRKKGWEQAKNSRNALRDKIFTNL